MFFNKKIVNSFLCLLFVFSCFIGCSDLEKLDDNSSNVKYGSISIVNGEDRKLEVDAIKYVRIEIVGTGISSPIVIDNVTVSDGKGSVKIDNIPVGKNRVITVYALDNSKVALQGVTMRAIFDVEQGDNGGLIVNWNSTKLGNIFYELLKLGVDVNNNSIRETIEEKVDKNTHALLLNVAQIAKDYKDGSLSSKNSSDYILEYASASVNFTQNSGDFKIQVCDPLSAITNGKSGFTDIENIAPGTWKIILIDSNGTTIKEQTLNVFESGKNLQVDMNEKEWTDIVVHAKAKYVWWWPTGQDGKCATMIEETSGWYGYTFENVSEMNLIFGNSNFGANDWSEKLTSDLYISASGEYWYKGGTWFEGDPDDNVVPVITSFSADKTVMPISKNVTFIISATDNTGLSKAKLYINGEILGSVNLSGTQNSASFVWNSAEYQNGTYTVSCIVYDGAGNASTEKTLEFTTNNENLPPIAIISGSSKATPTSDKTFSGSSSYDQTKGGTIKSYAWSVSGGGTIKSGANADSCTVTMPNSEGTVKITLTVTDAEGATGTATKEITVAEKTSSSNDFREESIYFLMTTRFYDGDTSNNEYCWDEGGEYLPYGDGDCAWRGDFKGLIEKLDYIKALGFSAIWITPVVQNSSGIDYHGYHAYDFKTVDPRYESTGASFQDLIDACHKKGIKVIQDIVLNHTGNFGEKNLFNMFKKDTEPYVNAELPLPTGAQWPRSPFYSVNEKGNAYSKLMAGLAMQGKGSTTDAYNSAIGGVQYGARINAMKEDTIDTDLIYHHAKMIDWNSINCQLGQMAGDCVDINTENPTVIKYLIEAYSKYIEMGVDAFRIDTVKHINRLIFNKYFNPAFMEAAKQSGNENFYMFGEVCARYRGEWNEGVPSLSPSFYTWKETEAPFTGESLGSYGTEAQNTADTAANFAKYASGFTPPIPKSESNTFLKGNDYHTPDYTNKSDLCVIDFPMHWAFKETGDAFNTALQFDHDYSDATWNVVYVDSHDYAPDNAPENKRFNGYWPDKLNLMWTFRGIPCIYYGSEIEFMKGKAIDPANDRVPLNESGRAYFGDHLEGSVTASDYGVYTASGTVAETLNHELAQQIIALNKIRRAVPALQKGQYSTKGCSGGISFKRRYTNTTEKVDSFVLVAINGQATFSDIPSGTYTEMVTGTKVSSSGSLTSDAIETGNMRVYVLNYNGESGFKGGTLK